jgi:2-succinyl-6-hydroxy-2,4-cyclohexadiene-1-carboxylate synthase
MGGRYALTAAVARHRQIERLVLIGATAGFVSAGERAERIRLDEERAVALERDGVEEFLDSWLAGPMFAALPDDPHGRLRRERNTATGLAASLRGAGTGSQAPQWSSLDSIEIPVLVIAGERDEKFTEIGRRLTAGRPNGEFVNIEHAGHATHIERPDATGAAIVAWLRRCR